MAQAGANSLRRGPVAGGRRSSHSGFDWVRSLLTTAALTLTAGVPAGAGEGEIVESVVWELDNVGSVGGLSVTVEGAPRVVETDKGRAVAFDGSSDALQAPTNPIAGLTNFTIEVLFRPDAGGLPEQRFFHIQENETENRALLETRLTADGQWYADTYIRSGRRGRALANPALLHPCGVWHTLALTYDGRQMVQYVNGVRELSGAVTMAPLRAGRTSIGARMNKVNWFKGSVRRVRFTPRALAGPDLLKP